MKLNLSFITTKTLELEKDIQIRVDSLTQYLDSLTCSDGKFIYRGQPNVDYKLVPKIGRIPLFKNNPSIEKDMFLEFKRSYCSYYDKKLAQDMEILMLAQHYGLPTRLLDWTTDPLVALYFACCKEPKSDGIVYIKSLVKENRYEDITVNENPFDYHNNLIIMPDTFEVRFEKQKGLFELFAQPTEEAKRGVSKIIVNAKAKYSIIDGLKNSSHGLLDLFPTLDTLCHHIEEEYCMESATPKQK